MFSWLTQDPSNCSTLVGWACTSLNSYITTSFLIWSQYHLRCSSSRRQWAKQDCCRWLGSVDYGISPYGINFNFLVVLPITLLIVLLAWVKIEQLYRAPPELKWRPIAIAMHCVALPTSAWLCFQNLVRPQCLLFAFTSPIALPATLYRA